MKTVEELYAEAQTTITKLAADASGAQATITKLNADAEAGAALLTEAQTKVTELTKQNEALTLAHGELKTQRDELAGKVTSPRHRMPCAASPPIPRASPSRCVTSSRSHSTRKRARSPTL